jgi:hypothetical protein
MPYRSKARRLRRAIRIPNAEGVSRCSRLFPLWCRQCNQPKLQQNGVIGNIGCPGFQIDPLPGTAATGLDGSRPQMNRRFRR